MHISFTAEQEQLRQRLRDYFAELMTPELRTALASSAGEYGDGDAYQQVVRQLGRDGWLAIGWPAEYGGRDLAVLDQLIFTEEAAIAGVRCTGPLSGQWDEAGVGPHPTTAAVRTPAKTTTDMDRKMEARRFGIRLHAPERDLLAG